MSDNVLNVILGVIGNVLTSLIACLTTKAGNALIGEEFISKWELEKTALLPLLETAINEVGENIEISPPPSMEELCIFIASPEVEEILRQLYCVTISADKDVRRLSAIKKEFSAVFTSWMKIDGDKGAEKAGYLFRMLQISIETTLNNAIDKGILSAHEAKSNLRHKLISDQLCAIEKNLEFLTQPYCIAPQDAIAFEEKYRSQVWNRFKYITPPSFDSTRKIPIADIYVSSNLIPALNKNKDKQKAKDDSPISMNQFLTGLYRAVILGNPGGGKTTLIQKLCHDIAKNYEKRLFANRLVTPIPVVLRDYGNEKKAHGYSILDYIEAYTNAHFQIKPPAGAFEYLLRNGRVVVIFDGLDELVDTSYRRVITEDVESFCLVYPSVPVLVTSREVGYEQAPLGPHFAIFRLAPFNDKQLTEYVTKWFSVESESTANQKKQQVDSFLNESRVVPDLRSNPLMLALMCNIYRGENYIPKNRPDVYEKCANMLFERWDKHRGIVVPLPFEEHIRPAMKFLAFWIYSHEASQAGVTEENLVSKTSDYLCEKRFDDRDEAEMAARRFIEFCRGRAWVFTDTGTTADGEKIYQFTHRTFLEYFAAAHLVRTNYTPQQLLVTLRPRIANREWDVVAQLAFQIQSRSLEGAGDLLILALVDPREDSAQYLNQLSFAVRCLNFMVPSPRVTKKLVEQSINNFFQMTSKEKSVNIIAYLIQSSQENRATIADSLEKLLTDRLQIDKQAHLAVQLIFNLAILPHLSIINGYDPAISAYWATITQRIIMANQERLIALSQHRPYIAAEMVWRSQISIIQFIDWHGTIALMQNFSILSGMIKSSMIEHLFGYILYDGETKHREDIVARSTELGSYLLAKPTPWIIVTNKNMVNLSNGNLLERYSPDLPMRDLPSIDQNSIWSLFYILAIYTEWNQQNTDIIFKFFSNRTQHSKNENKLLGIFLSIFSWRFNQPSNSEQKLAVTNIIKDLQVNEQITEFIDKWAKREINIIKFVPRQRGKK